MVRRALVVAALAVMPARVEAFCGFYIDTGGEQMFNDATQVVLMRDGTRTVLAMQNNYDGPVQDFAMVIPVPAVLTKDSVRTLPKSLFQKVNAMSSPRLVEYWEQDPCEIIRPEGTSVDARDFAKHSSAEIKYAVKVEAKFDVDEYNVVILSAKDSTGLDGYLRSQHYKIPRGAAPLLRPYVEAGSKFFVAKVDPKKVKFEKGRAVLSPLRFHYDSDEFSLPIRLGLANSAGVQDLIVNIIAESRYDVANYPNVFMTTNVDVDDAVRTRFGEFYAALFDRTVQQHPGAVVTEYAWNARGCDPCPGPTLADEDFLALGEEVLVKKPPPPPPPPSTDDEIELDLGLGDQRDWVLTRLHARYGTEGAPRDLVFKKAAPVYGGSEMRRRQPDGTYAIQRGVVESEGGNRFQSRYVIRHAWKGALDCKEPRRGMWGDNPDRSKPRTWSRQALGAATDSAGAPRGKIALHELVAGDVPELAIQKGVPLSPPLPGPPPARRPRPQSCGCGTAPVSSSAALVVLVLAALRRRRR